MSSELVLVERLDGVTRVTLNRPEVLNSFNRPMAGALRDALLAAGDDASQRAIVLTGAGRAFCAGQDLAEAAPRADGSLPDLGDIVRESYNPVLRAIRTVEKPVLCAVNGIAAGAGANIAFACDLVFAAEEAAFVESFNKLGLIPDSGGTFILPRIVGLQRANALVMLGEKFSANQACEWGLVYRTVPAAVLMDTVMETAKQLATQPTRGFGLMKRAFNKSLGIDLDAQLGVEAELQGEAGKTADYAEGVRAFLAKRAPVYTGR